MINTQLFTLKNRSLICANSMGLSDFIMGNLIDINKAISPKPLVIYESIDEIKKIMDQREVDLQYLRNLKDRDPELLCQFAEKEFDLVSGSDL